MNVSFDLNFLKSIEKTTAEFGRRSAESVKQELPNLGIATQQIAGGGAVFAGVASPITQAIGVGLDGSVSSDELARLEAFFFQRKADVVLELTPYIDESVLQWIRDRPYGLVEFSQIHTLSLSGDIRESEPGKGIAIRIVQPAEYKVFTRTVAEGYAESVPLSDEDLLIFEGFSRAPGALSFLATIDGVPAGGAMLSVEGELAGLHGGSTLPQFRGRGLQTMLICARLREAQRRGCRVAYTVTHPSGSSQRNMARFGFQPAYTRVKMSRPFKTG